MGRVKVSESGGRGLKFRQGRDSLANFTFLYGLGIILMYQKQPPRLMNLRLRTSITSDVKLGK